MIPVVFNCDNNYIMPTCVAISSIIENNKEYQQDYCFKVLVSEKIEDKQEIYIERLRVKYPLTSIEFLEADEYVKNATLYGSHITSSTYLRLFIPWILTEYDKCIFIDTDVIVNCEITELLELDMHDIYIAGVKEYELNHNEIRKKQKFQKLGIPDSDIYLYAGMLVMNLQMLRKDFDVDLLRSEMEKGYQYQDQDVLNKLCILKKKTVPVKYNFLNRHLYAQKLLDTDVYAEEEIKDTYNNGVIIHYPGKNKPWLYLKGKGGKEWWYYADSFLGENEKQVLKTNAENYQKSITWNQLCNICDKYEKIIIWGFSDIGRYVLCHLKRRGYSIALIGDNDKSKIGMKYEDIEVKSMKEVCEAYNAATLIIQTSQLAYGTINRQLIQNGISEKNIFTYTNKGRIYYKSLEEEYYPEELREIIYREFGDYALYDEYGYVQLCKVLKNKTTEWAENISNEYWLDEWLLLNNK